MTDLERITVEYEMALKNFHKESQEAYDEPTLGEFEEAYDKALHKFRPYKTAYDRARTPEMSLIPKYGSHMTLQDFEEEVESGMFTDYDGHGKYATKDQMTDINIMPSHVEDGVHLKNYSPIVWFNK